MSELMRRLEHVPFGTDEHAKVVKKLQQEIKSRDFVLCMKGAYERDRHLMFDKNVGLDSGSELSVSINEVIDTPVFGSDFYFMRRDKAEYDLHHRQVNVGLIVRDKSNNVLVLRKRNDYMTLVGGHTDYTKRAYNMNIHDLLVHNTRKEYGEEVKTSENLIIGERPKWFVTEGVSLWDHFHAWFIYDVLVDDLHAFKFSSNEEKKHDTEIVSIEKLLNRKEYPKLKNSLRQVLSMIEPF